MEERPMSGRFVPVLDVLQVALGACVLAFARTVRDKSFVEWRWTLAEHSALSIAVLATASTVDRWTRHEDPERALLVARLHLVLEGKPDESFASLSARLLARVSSAGGIVFTLGHTVGGSVPYYEMATVDISKRLIMDVSQEHGALVTAFADDVEETFAHMRVFVSEAEDVRRGWEARHAA